MIFFNWKNVYVFQYRNKLDNKESYFLPGYVEYSIVGDDLFENKYKAPSLSFSRFLWKFFWFPRPKSYVSGGPTLNALAKTEELSVEISDGCKQCNIYSCDNSIVFVTDVSVDKEIKLAGFTRQGIQIFICRH